MKKIIEFLFFRWKKEIVKRGTERWFTRSGVTGTTMGDNYSRDYVEYKYTNKFDGSTKIKRVYLN